MANMAMTEDEFARKARKEYRKASEREKERISKSERSLKNWLSKTAKKIWEGAKDLAKGFISSLAAVLLA